MNRSFNVFNTILVLQQRDMRKKYKYVYNENYVKIEELFEKENGLTL